MCQKGDKLTINANKTKSMLIGLQLQLSEFDATVETPQPVYGEEDIDEDIIATVSVTVDMFRVPLQGHIVNNAKIITIDVQRTIINT